MDTLITITQTLVGDDTVNSVNARDLHAFLGVGKDFSTWIKDQIETFGFIEHTDFEVLETTPQIGGVGNRGLKKEYIITLDMGKELAMVSRSEKGRQVRRYFIECEKLLRSGGEPLPSVKPILDKVLPPQPKLIPPYSFQEVAGLLGVDRNDLCLRLRRLGILEYYENEVGKYLIPTKEFRNPAIFVVSKRRFEDHEYPQTRVTGRGFDWIQEALES